VKIVVDTNIAFSGILNTDGKIGDLLMNSFQIFEFYSCQYLRQEIHKHQDKLLEISKLSSEELKESKFQIFNCIEFISEEQIEFVFWTKAAQLVRDVDMDDIAFVALNQYLEDARLWTGDKQLLEGLRAKGYKKCISTEELFELRRKIEEK